MKALQDKQIGCAVYFPVPLLQQNAFQEEFASVVLPVTESVVARCFLLPICSYLTNEEIHEICDVIKSVF